MDVSSAKFFLLLLSAEAEVWLRHGAQGVVKILKLKFGQYFEADAYLRFDNIWKLQLGTKIEVR